MKYYQEITLIPDCEVPVMFLWTKLFGTLHLAFVNQRKENNAEFGISFPQYSENGVGEKLRIFAEKKEMLEALQLDRVLNRMQDYVHIVSVRKIPVRRLTGYAIYSRYQPDASVEQKARRYAKRHPESSYEEALEFMKQRTEKYQLPYIQIKSLSNGQFFPLFIRKKTVEEESNYGFGTYGLSAKSSVPEF